MNNIQQGYLRILLFNLQGLYPESHGIISNNMYDADIGEVFTLSSQTKSDPRWWGGEPVCNLIKS